MKVRDFMEIVSRMSVDFNPFGTREKLIVLPIHTYGLVEFWVVGKSTAETYSVAGFLKKDELLEHELISCDLLLKGTYINNPSDNQVVFKLLTKK